MANEPHKIILQKKKNIEKVLPKYLESKSFERIVSLALVDFIKRVKRGYMPDLGSIPPLSDNYIETRKRYKSNLGKLAKAAKSNATATGQMLDAMLYEVTATGFALYVADSKRKKELSGSESKLTNAEVAGWYALNRFIFELSAPEIARITRNIKRDLTALIKNA